MTVSKQVEPQTFEAMTPFQQAAYRWMYDMPARDLALWATRLPPAYTQGTLDQLRLELPENVRAVAPADDTLFQHQLLFVISVAGACYAMPNFTPYEAL
jgi:hypothetical protein